MSETGAKLVLPHIAVLPDAFEVQVARLERVYAARVIWRRRYELGVSFQDGASAGNVVPIDRATRVRKLEADKSILLRRIAELSGGE